MNDLQKKYSTEIENLSKKIKELRGNSRKYIFLEITSFCLAVAAFAFYCTDGMKISPLLCAIAMLITYFMARRADVVNDKKIRNMTKRRLVYSREISYLKNDFTVFDDGTRYIDPQHAFTFDMDVFGPESLFNRINRTVTTGGSDMLAHSLATLPSSTNDIRLRQEAIDELSKNEEWRTEFLARGQRLTNNGKESAEKIDTTAILHAIKEVNDMRFPHRFKSKTALGLAYTSLTGFYLCVVLSIFTSLPAAVPCAWGIVQMFIIIGLTARPLREITKEADRLNKQMQSYVGLIRHIHSAKFKSKELESLQATLFCDDSDALKSFSQLDDTINRIDRRTNEMALIVFNMLFLNDFFIVRSFLRWQSNYMGRMSEWVNAVSLLDALVSMAVLRYNRPEATTAVIDNSDEVVYEAEGLYHPFLGATAVNNDFRINDGHYYIITGANMAGKSTFLRSIGINYILAMNGMPVFANRLQVSLFNIFSSMRTSDDLSHGISYFNAELLRLRQLIDSCKQHRRTLIILDEILKGTNSLDKLNGSRLFLSEISRLPVSGIIATHDLELSKMEKEYPERFHNYCFEIQLTENITYTYRISRGVARNQNATFLLKRIISNI